MPTPKASPNPVEHCRASGSPRPSRKPADSHFELFESWKPSPVLTFCATPNARPPSSPASPLLSVPPDQSTPCGTSCPTSAA